MNKIKLIGLGVLSLAIITAVLLYNKSKTAAKTKTDTKLTYYVSVDIAGIRGMNEELSFTGVISANNDVAVISETQGKVTGVFSKVGDYKQAGSVLVQVDDELKKASYNSAEANYQKAKKDFERYRQLYEQKAVTDAQFDAAKLAYVTAETQYTQAKRQLSDTRITTPISGTITSRTVDMGSMVQQGMVIANVVDISRLKVKVNVSEQSAFKLRTGDLVEVTTDVYPGQKFQGRIETISVKGDDSHTYPIEVVMPNNSKYPLKAGMFGRVSLSTKGSEQVLSIPRAAVLGGLRNPQVYVVTGGTAKLRPIVTGREFGTYVEVLGGLTSGEQVVVNGQNTLQDNVTVEVLK